MPNPNALIDGVSSLEPSREPLAAIPSEAPRQFLVVNFQGGRSGFLDLKNPLSAVWAQMLDLQRQTDRPVYVEIDPETSLITQLLIPEASRVMSITPPGEGDVSVVFYTSEARHYLRQQHPDFQQMLKALQTAKDDEAAVLVTAIRPDHEIIDVRPLPKPPGAETPDPLSPPQPDPPVSPQRAQELFDLMNSESCDPCNASCQVLPHCIPFKHPDDGCYARAHEMCRLMMAEGETPEKVWIYGNLLVNTSNNPDCLVEWGWHVAPTLMVTAVNGPPIKMVIDPSLCTTPVTPEAWRALQGDPNATLKYTTWEPFWSDLTSTDPDFSETNYYLQQKCLYLQQDCAVYGPPPYECPITKKCSWIIDRSTFGEDEIAARLQQATPAIIDAAFYVVVDGFKPAIDTLYGSNYHDCLGITPATLIDPPNIAPTIAITPQIPPGMSVEVAHVALEDPMHLKRRQRVTWTYQVKFVNTDGFVDGFVNDVKKVTLTASIASVTDASVSVSGSADISLIKQPNPFEIDGQVSWLSSDLRVFQIKAGEAKFGVTLGSTPDQAPVFIKQVITNLNTGNTGGQTFENDISNDQQTSKLELAEKDANDLAVYNFAVARVRYRGKLLDAENVRVFFRLFPASTTSLDYQQASTYRCGGQAGVTIPLLGILGGNLVTIPCFAEPRINSLTEDLNTQTDPQNVQTILHDATGAERIAYFGCWLDINQPSQPQFPIQPGSSDGPYPADRKTIQELIRHQHQCLVAEIAFDPDPIPLGATPGSSDKLAQRNLTIVESANPGDLASRRIPVTFHLRSTRSTLQPDEMPDELMIDWGNTPVGSLATLYLPGVSVIEILRAAVKMYGMHRFVLIDDHTLRCQTGGITYVPLPPGMGADVVGLLTVDLPHTVHKEQVFTIVVRQVTSAIAASPVAIGLVEHTTVAPFPVKWRRIVGSFQVTIPVRPKEVLLEPERRLLSVLRWIQKAIPVDNRWFPVFRRYVEQTAGRVDALGGDAQEVKASPLGDWKDSKAKLCHNLALLTGSLLALLVITLGSLGGGWLVIVGILVLVCLAGVGKYWLKNCRPSQCSLLRTLIGGAGSGATLLALLFLLGVSTPRPATILALSVLATGLAALVGWLKRCF